MQLPNELISKTLLALPEEKLLEICASEEYRDFCKQSFFWRERFNAEGIPLLMEGHTPFTWSLIYRRSLQALDLVEKFWGETTLEEEEFLASLTLGKINNISLLDFSQADPVKVKEFLLLGWQSLQEKRIIKQSEEKIPESYYTLLEIYQRKDGRLEISLVHINPYWGVQREYTFVVSQEELDFFLFKVYFYALPLRR